MARAPKPLRAQTYATSRASFYRNVAAGEYEKIGRGLYLPADTADLANWDWLEATSRHRRATICLTSALAYYDLTDDIPRALDIALPRGTRPPRTSSAIEWHQFDTRTFDLGRTTIMIPGSRLHIGIYSPMRCIADAFRLRGSQGYEVGRDALKRWLEGGGKPAELMTMANGLPRAKAPVMRMLEAFA